jgi:DNA-directed RNA polymerase alpha subunit
VPGQSFYLGKGEEASDCEYTCKVKVVKPRTGVYEKSTSSTFDIQYGTQAEKTGVSVKESFYYKPCNEVSTGVWECPVEAGEEKIEDCRCVNAFGAAATVMQAIRQAGQDIICSSGRWY